MQSQSFENATEDSIKKAAKILAESKNTVALTGSGISVESNIQPFRGKGGLWETIDPMEFAHIDNFLKNPEKVWKSFLAEMKDIIANAVPNDGHKGLFVLEKKKKLTAVITQNIDGLHQAAGNTDVIEFHGTFAKHICLECKKSIDTKELKLTNIPPLCDCGGIYRPDCIFFGEMIREDVLQRSRHLASSCEAMLVIGTSAVVYPAASMPFYAKKNKAKIIEINPESTPLTESVTDIFIGKKAGEAMNRLVNQIREFL